MVSGWPVQSWGRRIQQSKGSYGEKTVEAQVSGGSAKHPAENPSLSANPGYRSGFFIYAILYLHIKKS